MRGNAFTFTLAFKLSAQLSDLTDQLSQASIIFLHTKLYAKKFNLHAKGKDYRLTVGIDTLCV